MRKTLFYPLILFSFCLTNAYAQRARPDSISKARSYWGTFGLGGSSVGFLGILTANAEIGHYAVFSAVAEAEANGWGQSDTNNLNVTRYNVLFGKIFRQQYTFLTVSAGAGMVDFSTYDMVHDNTSPLPYKFVRGNFMDRRAFEVPVMVQFYLVMTNNVSFGIQGFADFNNVRTTEGFSLNFAFGRMRTRYGKIAQPKLPLPHPPRLF